MNNNIKSGAAQIAPFNAFADMDEAHFAHRHRLIPVEPGGKKPAFFDGVEWKPYPVWQKVGELTAQRLANYQKAEAANMGLVLGPHPALASSMVVGVFDMDVTEPKLKAAIEPVMQGAGLMEFLRFGNPEKMGAAFVVVKLPYANARLGKQVIDFGGGQKVEFLCDGSQVLLHGLHLLGCLYAWADPKKSLPACPITALPVIPLEQYREIMVALAEAGTVSGFKASDPSAGTGTALVGHAEFPKLPEPDARLLQAGLAEAADKNDIPRGEWVQLVKAYAACCEDALGIEQVADDLIDFTAKYTFESGNAPTEVLRVLDERTLPVGFGLHQLCELLAERVSDATAEALCALARRAEAQHVFGGAPVDQGIVEQLMQQALAAARVNAMSFDNADLTKAEPKSLAELLACGLDKLPPRSWLVRGLIMLGALTVIGGAGGSGKSSLLNGTALSIASGQSLMGFDLRNPHGEAVLILNADDDEAEIARRFGALAQFYNVAPEALGRIHVIGMDKLGDARACHVKGRGGELVFNGDWLDRVSEWIDRIGAKAVILDPLAGIADLDENSNEHMGALAGWLNAFAAAKGISVVLVHHASKGGVAAAAASGGDRNANLIAGGRRLLDKARAAFVIDGLGDADAAHVGLGKSDERLRQMFGLWGVKGNYMARGAARAYFRIEAVGLNNARGLDPSDTVGVAVRYTPARAAATDAVLLAILDLIAAGTAAGPYTRRKASGLNPRYIVPAVVGAVNWLAEGLSGPPGEKNILDLLSEKVLTPGLAQEQQVQVSYTSKTKAGLGIVLTPAGEAELIRLKSADTENDDCI